jgi:hypothetical protein
MKDNYLPELPLFSSFFGVAEKIIQEIYWQIELVEKVDGKV